MMTVLQVIPSLGAGGAEQACVDMTRGLVQAGHRALVVSSGGPRVRDIEQAGGEHIARNVASKNPLQILANAVWLARLIRARGVNVVHARSRAPAWSAFWASRMAACAFVTTFHAAYKFSGPFKKFYNGVMARGDRVIAISEFIARHVRENYGVDDKLRTIPRGINLDVFSPEAVTDERCARLRALWKLVPNEIVILVPARLSPIKGQGVIIEAMTLLSPQFRNVTAVIVGDDQGRSGYRQHLERKIEARDMQERVKIVPHCDDMPAAYRLSSLVVAPSLVPEGFGRVPVEAMAMGAPVIASNLGGMAETIRDGVTGWLVPPNQPHKLADAIVNALMQSDAAHEAMVHAAIDHARTRYDTRVMVAGTLAAYAEASQVA